MPRDPVIKHQALFSFALLVVAWCATLILVWNPESCASVPTNVQFSSVTSTSLTTSWVLDVSSSETPLMVLSTTSTFVTVVSSGIGTLGQQTSSYASLTYNTTYWFEVKVSTEPSYSSPSATATLAQIPGIGSPVFPSIQISSIVFQWSSSGNPTGTYYLTQISTDNFSTVNFSSSTTNLNALFGLGGAGPPLTAGTSYFFRVEAINFSNLHTGFAVTQSTMTISLPSAPAAPTGFAGTAQGPTSILWTWVDNASNENGYRVMSGASNISGDLPANTTSWLQTGLSINTLSGPLFARAFNPAGTSDSSSASRYTFAVPPGSAAVPFSSVSSSGMTVNWSSGTSGSGYNPTGTQYLVQVSTAPDFSGSLISATVTSLSAAVTSLAGNTTYYTKVQALNFDNVGTSFNILGPLLTGLLISTQTNVVTSGNGRVILTIPDGALSQNYSVNINTSPVTTPVSSPLLPQQIAQATNTLARNAPNGSSGVVSTTLVEVNAYNSQNQNLGAPLATPATISVGFQQQNGLVTGSPTPIRVKTLALHSLDPTANVWVKLPTSQVDATNNVVTALTPHFSVFAIIGHLDTDLQQAYAFPVPFQPSLGHQKITFINLAQIAKIRIFSAGGTLVRTLSVSDGSGKLDWDVTNSQGSLLASGVYFYLIESSADKKTGKLMVIR